MSTATNNNSNVHGHVSPGWELIRSVFEKNFADGLDIGASMCIYHQGECVVNLAGGWKDAQTKTDAYTSDTLQLVFSVTQGVIAAAAALCVQMGWLDYDACVAQYWPEFAAKGKQNITVGNVLSHRSGLPYIDEQLTLEDCSWSRITSILAGQKPLWEPGTACGYNPIVVGFIIGELIRRVDPKHRSYNQFIHDEVDSGFSVGVINDDIKARVAPLIRKVQANLKASSPMSPVSQKALTCSGVFPADQPNSTDTFFNRSELQRSKIPCANGFTNAHSLARIYALLIGDVTENGETKRLINNETLLRATKCVAPADETDQILVGTSMNVARGGFQLYGDYFKALGVGVFGHKGMGGTCAMGYPPQQLSFAYVCNQVEFGVLTLDQRSVRMLQAIKSVLENRRGAHEKHTNA